MKGEVQYMEKEWHRQFKGVCTDYAITNMANAAAFLYAQFEHINWVGFYLYHPQDDVLILGPFQGKIACTTIQRNRGVCGTAFHTNEDYCVSDVHSFEGHIACDPESASECVCVLRTNEGVPFGVLDVDSPLKGRFKEADYQLLRDFCDVYASFFQFENFYTKKRE